MIFTKLGWWTISLLAISYVSLVGYNVVTVIKFDEQQNLINEKDVHIKELQGHIEDLGTHEATLHKDLVLCYDEGWKRFTAYNEAMKICSKYMRKAYKN